MHSCHHLIALYILQEHTLSVLKQRPHCKSFICRYVGKCSGLPKGHWVGVQFDEPVGKNNGRVKGKQYFTCSDGYGSLLRPDKVKAGDYPEVDDFRFSDEDEI